MNWVKDLQQSLEKLGWRGLNVTVVALDGLTIKEVKQLLKDWRRVKAVWREKAKGRTVMDPTAKEEGLRKSAKGTGVPKK